MANSSAIRAGRAFVELFADDSKLVRGLKAASTKLKAWGAGIRSLGTKVFAAGAGLLAPMLLSVRQFMSTGDALDKMSSRVGASVEFLSALSHAAQIGGTDIAAMEVGIRRMQRTAMDATRGLSTAVDAFDELGISVTDSSGKLKGTEQLFMESAAALAKVDNNTKKAALATMIFGRAGTSLLPMLRDGADGLVAVMEEAKRLGLVMSTEDATAAAALDEQELAIAKEELSGQMQKKIKARTEANQSDLAAIDREWEGKIAELDQQQADALKALGQDSATRLAATNADVKQARNEFYSLVDEANRKAARGTAYGMPKKKGPGQPDMEGVTKASVMGTFSAVVAARLGAGGPAERTARATEEAAGHLKFIRRRFEFTGPTTSTFQ